VTDFARLPPGTHTLPSGCVVTIRSASLPGASGGKRAGDLGSWGYVLHAEASRVVLAFSLPARTLWPNARVHYMARARAVREHRDRARNFAEMACWCGSITEPWKAATFAAAFFWPDLKRRDGDNACAALKAYQDGLVDGGLLAGDSTDVLRHLPASFDVDRKNPRVELTIERSGGNGD
jgi:hypothetical protein